MFKFIEKRELEEEEKSEIISLLNEIPDVFGDFYLTKNNIRLYIRENPEILFLGISTGDKIIYNKVRKSDNVITASDDEFIAVVVGYADKSNRKYLKILAKNVNVVKEILEAISWKIEDNLYMKIKKNDPIRKILLENRFEVIKGRGKEILLRRGK